MRMTRYYRIDIAILNLTNTFGLVLCQSHIACICRCRLPVFGMAFRGLTLVSGDQG